MKLKSKALNQNLKNLKNHINFDVLFRGGINLNSVIKLFHLSIH